MHGAKSEEEKKRVHGRASPCFVAGLAAHTCEAATGLLSYLTPPALPSASSMSLSARTAGRMRRRTSR